MSKGGETKSDNFMVSLPDNDNPIIQLILKKNEQIDLQGDNKIKITKLVYEHNRKVIENILNNNTSLSNEESENEFKSILKIGSNDSTEDPGQPGEQSNENVTETLQKDFNAAKFRGDDDMLEYVYKVENDNFEPEQSLQGPLKIFSPPSNVPGSLGADDAQSKNQSFMPHPITISISSRNPDTGFGKNNISVDEAGDGPYNVSDLINEFQNVNDYELPPKPSNKEEEEEEEEDDDPILKIIKANIENTSDKTLGTIPKILIAIKERKLLNEGGDEGKAKDIIEKILIQKKAQLELAGNDKTEQRAKLMEYASSDNKASDYNSDLKRFNIETNTLNKLVDKVLKPDTEQPQVKEEPEESKSESEESKSESEESKSESEESKPEPKIEPIRNDIKFRLDDKEIDNDKLIYKFIQEYIQKQKDNMNVKLIDKLKKQLETKLEYYKQKESKLEEKKSEIQNLSEKRMEIRGKINKINKAIETMEIPEYLMSGGVKKLDRVKIDAMNRAIESNDTKAAEKARLNKEGEVADPPVDTPAAAPVDAPGPLGSKKQPKRKKLGEHQKKRVIEKKLSSVVDRKKIMSEKLEENHKLHEDINKLTVEINNLQTIRLQKEYAELKQKLDNVEKEVNEIKAEIANNTKEIYIDKNIIDKINQVNIEEEDKQLKKIIPSQEDSIFDLLNKYITFNKMCENHTELFKQMKKPVQIVQDIWFSKINVNEKKQKSLFKNVNETLKTIYKLIMAFDFQLNLFNLPNSSDREMSKKLKQLKIYQLTIPNLIKSRNIWNTYLGSMYEKMNESNNKGVNAIQECQSFHEIMLKLFPTLSENEHYWEAMAYSRIMVLYVLLPTIGIWNVNYSKGKSPDKWWINIIFKDNIKKVYKGRDDEYIGINGNPGDHKAGLAAKCMEDKQLIPKIPLLIKDYFNIRKEGEDNNQDKIYKIENCIQFYNDFKLGKIEAQEIKKHNDSHHSGGKLWTKKLNLDMSDLSPFKNSEQTSASRGGNKKTKNKTKKNKKQKRKSKGTQKNRN